MTKQKVVSFHIGDKLHSEVQKVRGEALLKGITLTQQEVMRGLVDRSLKELSTIHDPLAQVAHIQRWIQDQKD
jgi:hypothetical protein